MNIHDFVITLDKTIEREDNENKTFKKNLDLIKFDEILELDEFKAFKDALIGIEDDMNDGFLKHKMSNIRLKEKINIRYNYEILLEINICPHSNASFNGYDSRRLFFVFRETMVKFMESMNLFMEHSRDSFEMTDDYVISHFYFELTIKGRKLSK